MKTVGAAAASAGTLSILPACAGMRQITGAERKRPNVILVMTDDQGYGDIGCLGNSVIKTPNLDRLYAKSIRLTSFHVDPTCTPTRSALMTGRYSARTGAWHTFMGRSLLRKDEVTMGDVFTAGGYHTGIFGKWHLGDNYPFRPHDRGFGEALIHGGGSIGEAPDYWDNDYFDDTYFNNGKAEKFKGYCTDVWFNEAMKFIEASKDRPFFCYISTNSPHGPLNVAEKYSKPYKGRVPDRRARFYGMITNIDENIGRLTHQLRELGLEENTILIFLTDNGTASGAGLKLPGVKKNWADGFLVNGFNAGMRGKKTSAYEGGHRVPCFIRWPGGGLEGGNDIDRITAHIDLLPTLTELCGLKRPGGVKFDGISLVPLLNSPAGTWPDRTLFVHEQRIEHPQKYKDFAVMTDRWRLVGKELYDIKADPGQKNNIADKHPEVVAKLSQAYEDWWADISKRFDEYCEIIIGSNKENPTLLTCQSWHGVNVPWGQKHVRKGQQDNGFWAVEVARDGEYEFVLRRWPKELNKPIKAGIPGRKGVPGVDDFFVGKALNFVKARLKIADVNLTKPVDENDSAVTFRVKLKAGKRRLQTWFTDDKGESWGAYYVYVKRLS